MPVHPALRREALARLPVSLRRMGNAAMDGSLIGDKDLEGFAQLCRFTPDDQRHLMLPAFYASLNPAGIPSPDVLDRMLVTTDSVAISAIIRASMALGELARLPMTPRAAFPDLWARVWPWIKFLHTYHDSLTCIPEDNELYFNFLDLFTHFNSEGGKAVIGTTPGVREITGHAWTVLEDEREGIIKLCFYLRHDEGLVNASALAEIAEGAGGITNLASLTVKLLKCALVDGTDAVPLDSDDFFVASIAVRFMYEVNMYGGAEGPFGKALLSHGLAEILPSAMCRMNTVRTAHLTGPATLQLGLSVLHRWISTVPGFIYFSDAIRAGLLHLLVSAAMNDGDNSSDHLEFFLDVLPAYTVYHSVLVHLQKALRDVEVLAAQPAFTGSRYHPKWRAFVDLARSRLDFLAFFESPDYYSEKACDNLECDRIRLKDDFRRCSSCQDLYYCSKECQISDWKTGHRKTCKKFETLRQFSWERLTTRDRGFMRALLHNDYLALRRDILISQVDFLIVNPHTPFYTTFNYTAGWVTMTVSGVPDDGRGEEYHEPEWVARWEDQVRRASRSGGRMEIHTMSILVGNRQHLLIVPLRSNNLEVYDGVTRLAEMFVEEERRQPGGASTLVETGVDDLMEIYEASIH
ncbi:hypothetical protein B0H11DRAFT_2015499 [Mycena galericulata]|nr:hypothetical protein B0H11DRAFT_2015499 [Mycena galericulata]